MTTSSAPSAIDVRELAEALADVLVERGLVVAVAPTSAARVLDAIEVGRMLGRDRRWVYDHAAELGAFRYGDGPRARLGFDLVAVERWKREHQIQPSPANGQQRARRSRTAVSSAASLIPYEGLGSAPSGSPQGAKSGRPGP